MGERHTTFAASAGFVKQPLRGSNLRRVAARAHRSETRFDTTVCERRPVVACPSSEGQDRPHDPGLEPTGSASRSSSAAGGWIERFEPAERSTRRLGTATWGATPHPRQGPARTRQRRPNVIADRTLAAPAPPRRETRSSRSRRRRSAPPRPRSRSTRRFRRARHRPDRVGSGRTPTTSAISRPVADARHREPTARARHPHRTSPASISDRDRDHARAHRAAADAVRRTRTPPANGRPRPPHEHRRTGGRDEPAARDRQDRRHRAARDRQRAQDRGGTSARRTARRPAADSTRHGARRSPTVRRPFRRPAPTRRRSPTVIGPLAVSAGDAPPPARADREQRPGTGSVASTATGQNPMLCSSSTDNGTSATAGIAAPSPYSPASSPCRASAARSRPC